MDLQASFGVLSEVIEQYESRGRSVRNVEATAADAGERLRSTLSIPLCLCTPSDGGEASVTPRAATLTDGGLQVEFDAVEPTLPETDAATVTVTDRSVRVDGAGEVVLTVDLVVEQTAENATPAIAETLSPTEGGGDTDATGASDGPPDSEGTTASTPAGGVVTEADEQAPPEGGGDGAADDGAGTEGLARDESVPPYEDEPYLQRLYEACDTFDEMRREIPMDVAAETVRRYKIEAGVHDPTSYDVRNRRL